MRKALYLHGFSSSFNATSGKVKALQEKFDVIPYSYDSALSYDVIYNDLKNFILKNNIDFVMGSSLGGFLSIQLSSDLNLFAVALNPSTNPYDSLRRYIGKRKNFKTGIEFEFTEEAVNSYPKKCELDGCAVIYLMDGDETLDAKETFEKLNQNYNCKLISGGGHRFKDITPYLNEIIEEYNVFKNKKL